jgi:hypothetical protein
MRPQTQVSVSAPVEVRSQLVQHLQGWIDRPADDMSNADDLLDVLAMLNSLPLTTSEFGLAVSRLKNAQRYLVANEPGAARWELRILLGGVRDREHGRPIKRTFRRSPATTPGRIPDWPG